MDSQFEILVEESLQNDEGYNLWYITPKSFNFQCIINIIKRLFQVPFKSLQDKKTKQKEIQSFF